MVHAVDEDGLSSGCTENFRVPTPSRLARRELLNRLRYPEPSKDVMLQFET